jgi:hypothetical protein
MMKSGSKIGFCLLAIALFAASMIELCVAEEVRSGVSEGLAERSTSPALFGEDAAGSASKSESQSPLQANGDNARTPTGEGISEGTHAVTKNVNPPVANGGDADGIDTRITVLPRRLGSGRDKVGSATVVKSIAPRNLLARPMAAPGASEPAVRNAIGVSVVRREGLEQHIGEHVSSIAHGAASGAMGVAGTATSRFAKAEGPIERPTPNANLFVKPAALNRGAINGTSLIRPGSAPSGIGGPAKAIAGINGTAIRPKH